MAIKYDLLLKGGEVIDPSQNLRGILDLGFQNGKIAAVAERLSSDEAREVLDISGRVVTPGLIDLHGHYFERVIPFGVSADSVCLPNGVTTSVDAGSSGWMQFEAFKEYSLKVQKTRLMAMVNLSALGMLIPHRNTGYGPTVGNGNGPQALLSPDTVGELQDLRYAQVEEAIRCIQDNRDVVLGLKIRIGIENSGDSNAVIALERAREAAEATGSLIMVHISRVPIPLARVFDYLRPGDIVTHIFHSAENNILDEKGRVRPEVTEARARGIVMDTGAAMANFGVPPVGVRLARAGWAHVSRAAIEQGLPPDTISSDMTRLARPRPMIYTLPEVMTLFTGLGMSLEEVVAATTCNPAQAIGQDGVLGTLRVGAIGDAAVFELENGDFVYDDGLDLVVRCEQRLIPVTTVKDGRVWNPDEG